MPEGRLGTLLARLLPARVARDVFVPAWWDLEAGAPGRRAGPFRLLLLWLDCWRVTAVAPFRSPGEWIPNATDLRRGVRRLVREPTFTAVAGLTLALGVGANIAVFAVVEAVLLRPLPYDRPGELVVLEHLDQGTGFTKRDIALGDFVDMAARTPGLAGFEGYASGNQTLFTDERPVRVSTVAVTPGFFELLGTTPALGRSFREEDAGTGATPVAVLSHRLWRDVFGADPATVGRSVRIGSQTLEVVGVAPTSFDFPVEAGTDVFLPLSVPASAPEQRNNGWIYGLARLDDPDGLEAVNRSLADLSAQFARDYPTQNEGSLYQAHGLRDATVGTARQALGLMLGAVALVLFVACANVANLQMTRALGRRTEMAIRAALGAGRSRLVRQLVVESLVLTAFATALGVAAAHMAVRLLPRILPDAATVPGIDSARLDGAVLLFAVALAAVVAVAFGMLAATGVRAGQEQRVLSATRSGPGRRVRRWGAALVVGEIALAVVLLLGAGLVLRSFAGLMSVDPGFQVENVVTLEIQLPPRYQSDAPARAAFYRQAEEELESLPDVVEVGAATIVPLTGNNWTWPFERADQPWGPGERAPEVGWQVASGGYFEALGIPLVAGRLFDDRDTGDPPPVVVSEALAERFYPGEDAVGQFVTTWGGDREIIGVVGSIRRASLDEAPRMDMYAPLVAPTQTTLFVRTRGRPAGAVPGVRNALTALESDLAFLRVATLADIRGESVGVLRATTWLLGVFALVGLLLASVGIYGVMAYTTGQRTAEIGTRLAMGATRSDISRLVLRRGAAMTAAGLAVGLALGLATSQVVSSLLYGVTPTDPLTAVAVAVALGGTALLASWLPARRAASVAPVESLKGS